METINKKILVTGSAGFIGSALVLRLLASGDKVIGIDNHNNCYDPALKEARLARHANTPTTPICASTWPTAKAFKTPLKRASRSAWSISKPRPVCAIPLTTRWHTLIATSLALHIFWKAAATTVSNTWCMPAVLANMVPMPVWALQARASLLGKGDAVQRLCGNLQVDISNARSLLGWVPPESVEEGLRRAMAV
jgi:UDP-glucuronate 4-epimerase